jgi:dTDP-4-amino-4,6-dideoxygalactose transaminase
MLMKKGIQTQIGTYASHVQPVYHFKSKCPNSLEIFNRSLALPMYYKLEEKDIDMVAGYLKEAIGDLK